MLLEIIAVFSHFVNMKEIQPRFCNEIQEELYWWYSRSFSKTYIQEENNFSVLNIDIPGRGT